MNINACFSHNTDNWKTPKNIYDYFIKKLNCVDTFEYMSSFDEFNLDRGKNINIFCNPPFSKLKFLPKWVKHNVFDLYNHVFLLIPARTDTIYFHQLLLMKPNIIFIKGRLHYNDKGCAPFPSVLLVFDRHNDYQEYDFINQEDISYE